MMIVNFIKKTQRKFTVWIGLDNTAYLLWFLGAVSFQSGFIYCNQNNMGSFQSILTRALTLLMFNYAWIKIQGSEVFPSNCFHYLNIRNVILSIYGYAFAQAQFYLPLPIVHTIFVSGPLFIYIMDFIINKTTVSVRQISGVILASIGVLLTINSPLLVDQLGGTTTTQFTYRSTDPLIRLGVGLMLILATICWAYGQIVAKKIKGSAHYQSNFHLAVVMIGISGLLYVYKPADVSRQYMVFLKSLFWSGIPLALCNMFFIIALGMTNKTGNVSMIGFISIIYSYLLSLVRYNESVNIFGILGVILVGFGVYRIVKK